MSTYSPISCASYDQWEIWIIRRQLLEISLRTGETLAGIPEDLKTADHAEFVSFNGAWIRLDQIVQANPV